MRHVFSMETEREKDLLALAETIVNCRLKQKAGSCREADCRSCATYNELVRLGVYQQLSDEAREFFDVYVHREKMDMYPYPPTLYKMFGKAIAPGVSCTLKEAMQRLYKGKNEINHLVKKWVEKHGVRISIEPSESGSALETRYVITRIEPRESAHVDDVRELMGENEARDYRHYKSRG